MTIDAFTAAPEELIAWASAFSEFADGAIVYVELPTVSVKLLAVLIDVEVGSATVGRPVLLRVVVDDPAFVTFRSYEPAATAWAGLSVTEATVLSATDAVNAPVPLADPRL